MVSIGRLKPVERCPDGLFVHHNYNSGLGRSLPSRLFLPSTTSLFDYSDVLLKEDMERGSTLLDSMFPSLYSGIRRGRHYSYDITSPHSKFERTDLYPTSDVRVIPIKFEHSPERGCDSNNVKFQLLNGDSKKTEDQSYSSCFSDDFPTECSSPTSRNPPKNSKTFSFTDTLETSTRGLPLKSPGKSRLGSFDSAQNVQRYHAEDFNGRPEMWTTIPVHHSDSSSGSQIMGKPNSNNNSSGQEHTQAPTKRSINEAHASKKKDIETESMDCSRQSSITSIMSLPDVSDPDFEENEINYPPSYPIYDVLKGKLAKDSRTIDYIRGDGNCFFRALSKVLYGSEQYHKTVRSFIVDIIATNKSKFAQFVDKEDVQEHVVRMSEDHSWATTCEIYAASTLLQRDIFMLTPDHKNENYSWLLFKPLFKMEASNDISNHTCYISLCNTNGNHYDRVIANHGGCNCFLPYPELGKVV